MTPQEIKIGTRFEFEMLNKMDEKVGNTFVSQLLEYQPDSRMVISAPITESRVVYVPNGITVRLTFVHPLHGLLGFKALVSAKEYKGNIAVLIVEPDQTIEKIQRREHFRLDVIVEALIRPVIESPEPEASNNADESRNAKAADTESNTDASASVQNSVPAPDKAAEVSPSKGYTRNLSGSGVCLVSEDNFPRNSEVRIELDLNNNTKFKAKCLIIRSQAIEVRKGRSYELGMRFTEISKKDQDNLIRYIFEQQRMLLKKEK